MNVLSCVYNEIQYLYWQFNTTIILRLNNKKLNRGQLFWPAACMLINKESDDACQWNGHDVVISIHAKIVRFVKNWTKTGKFAGSTKLQFSVETAKFPTKIGKFPKITKDKKFDLRLRVPRLKLRYLQSWWKLSEDRVEKSSIKTVICKNNQRCDVC